QAVVPLGCPPAGRNGTLTPSAPISQGAASNWAGSGASVGRCPWVTAWSGSWSGAMARRPAAWTHSHTAWGLTDPARYHCSNIATVANGTKTASASPDTGAHHESADTGAHPGLHPMGPQVGSPIPGGTGPPAAANRSVQTGSEPDA